MFIINENEVFVNAKNQVFVNVSCVYKHQKKITKHNFSPISFVNNHKKLQ